MTKLIADLPDQLYWLTEKVEGLIKPAAYLRTHRNKDGREAPRKIAAVGSSHLGAFDVPADAPWADASRGWNGSYQDGESGLLQINIEEIPGVVLQQYPSMPAVGLIWVTINLRDWSANVYFDPRPASQITWLTCDGLYRAYPPVSMEFFIQDTMTCCTDATLPEIAGNTEMADDFDSWWGKHYAARSPSDVQIGGWIHPIQGECDEERKSLLIEVSHCEFGDSGSVYVHYSKEHGFFASLETH